MDSLIFFNSNSIAWSSMTFSGGEARFLYGLINAAVVTKGLSAAISCATPLEQLGRARPDDSTDDVSRASSEETPDSASLMADPSMGSDDGDDSTGNGGILQSLKGTANLGALFELPWLALPTIWDVIYVGVVRA